MSVLAGGQKGFADGPGLQAKFEEIEGIAIDDAGNLFAADNGNKRIRMISTSGTTRNEGLIVEGLGKRIC